MKTTIVTPKEGYSIFDPQLRNVLPATGREVEESLYWSRMERDGDVTVSEPPSREGTQGAQS